MLSSTEEGSPGTGGSGWRLLTKTAGARVPVSTSTHSSSESTSSSESVCLASSYTPLSSNDRSNRLSRSSFYVQEIQTQSASPLQAITWNSMLVSPRNGELGQSVTNKEAYRLQQGGRSSRRSQLCFLTFHACLCLVLGSKRCLSAAEGVATKRCGLNGNKLAGKKWAQCRENCRRINWKRTTDSLFLATSFRPIYSPISPSTCT